MQKEHRTRDEIMQDLLSLYYENGLRRNDLKDTLLLEVLLDIRDYLYSTNNK